MSGGKLTPEQSDAFIDMITKESVLAADHHDNESDELVKGARVTRFRNGIAPGDTILNIKTIDVDDVEQVTHAEVQEVIDNGIDGTIVIRQRQHDNEGDVEAPSGAIQYEHAKDELKFDTGKFFGNKQHTIVDRHASVRTHIDNESDELVIVVSVPVIKTAKDDA